METFLSDVGSAFSALASIQTLLIMLLGVTLGIILGALPGIGSSQALALLLPLTFGMDVNQAMLFFLAVYSGVEYGSAIPAILIRTPGSGGSAVTVLDGYPMARNGLAHKALRISLFSGVAGGILSTIIFIAAGTSLGSVALMFGPSELFAVGIFGISIIGSFFGRGIARGFLATGLGLLLATVGSSGFGGLRFTFDQGYLFDGIPLVVVLIAFLAGPEAFRLLVDHRRTIDPAQPNRDEADERNHLSFAELRSFIPTWIRGSIYGTAVGIIPGAGGSVASMLAYSQERRRSPTPEKFGTGHPPGVAAPESANNAVVAGTLVPSLSLGIPGSGGAAILLGVLISKGVAPGPLLFRDHGDFVMTVFIGLFAINLMLLCVGLVGTRIFSLVAKVPLRLLGPFIMILIIVGAYAHASYTPHVIMVLVLSAIAYLMEKVDIPVIPVVLAFIMGPIIEENFNRALTINNGDLVNVLTRPISMVIFAISAAIVVYSIYKSRGATPKTPQGAQN